MGTLQTVAIDTASSPWVYSDGIATTVSGTSETMLFNMNDLGSTAYWSPGGATNISLADGAKLTISSDSGMTQTPTLANGTASLNAMTLFCQIDGGPVEAINVTTMQAADVDGNNTDLTLTFEYPGKPYKWTWTGLNTTAS
jgi:hypothetical protein